MKDWNTNLSKFYVQARSSVWLFIPLLYEADPAMHPHFVFVTQLFSETR